MTDDARIYMKWWLLVDLNTTYMPFVCDMYTWCSCCIVWQPPLRTREIMQLILWVLIQGSINLCKCGPVINPMKLSVGGLQLTSEDDHSHPVAGTMATIKRHYQFVEYTYISFSSPLVSSVWITTCEFWNNMHLGVIFLPILQSVWLFSAVLVLSTVLLRWLQLDGDMALIRPRCSHFGVPPGTPTAVLWVSS